MRKHFVTWEDVEVWIDSIAVQMKYDNVGIKSIYGVPRGGLVPAVMLSHRTGLPLTFRPDRLAHSLVIDDICDSGRTLKSFYPHKKVAALVHKLSSDVSLLYGGTFGKADTWYVFPWETELSSKRDNL